MLAETPVIQCSPCYSEVSASLENTLPDCSNYPHFPTLCKINVSMYIPKQGDITSPCVTVLDFRVMDLSLSLSLSSLSSLSYLSLFSLFPLSLLSPISLSSLSFLSLFSLLSLSLLSLSSLSSLSYLSLFSLFPLSPPLSLSLSLLLSLM